MGEREIGQPDPGPFRHEERTLSGPYFDFLQFSAVVSLLNRNGISDEYGCTTPPFYELRRSIAAWGLLRLFGTLPRLLFPPLFHLPTLSIVANSIFLLILGSFLSRAPSGAALTAKSGCSACQRQTTNKRKKKFQSALSAVLFVDVHSASSGVAGVVVLLPDPRCCTVSRVPSRA